LGVLSVIGLWVAVSGAFEVMTLHPRRWDIGPPPSARGGAYTDVAFKDPAGLTLRGRWIPGLRHQTIVMVHGWTSSRREPYDKSQYPHAAGYNILVFDLRGHGRSDGSHTTMGWKEPDDVRTSPYLVLTAILGVAAIGLISWGLFANSLAVLGYLTIVVVAMWFVTSIRHLVEADPAGRSQAIS